jgi:hypothetical protein
MDDWQQLILTEYPFTSRVQLQFDYTGAASVPSGFKKMDVTRESIDVGSIDYHGLTNCAARTVKLDTDLNASQITGVARHEAGHFFRLLHTGKNDDWQPNGLNPAASTCLGVQPTATSRSPATTGRRYGITRRRMGMSPASARTTHSSI